MDTGESKVSEQNVAVLVTSSLGPSEIRDVHLFKMPETPGKCIPERGPADPG